jgi:hypothetical protein
MRNAYEGGVKLRYISEMTKNNIPYCRALMDIAELLHLDDVKGGMTVNKTENIATANLQEAKPVSHSIYSNVKEIVEQQQLLFERLWSKTTLLNKKLKKLKRV